MFGRIAGWVLIGGLLAGTAAALAAEPEKGEKGDKADKGNKADPSDGEKKPPFADKPKAPPPKPAERVMEAVQEGKFAFTVRTKPGIPSAGEVTEVLINANSIPKTPHPSFGSRVPIDAAQLYVELTSPAGEVVGRYVAHAIPLSHGKYGLHLTPGQDGIYNLGIRGTAGEGLSGAVQADLKLPVNVWPLPPELENAEKGAGASGSRRPVKM
jgi:hypothetical protein